MPAGTAPPTAAAPNSLGCHASCRSEVGLGVEHGLPEACVISCDNVITIPLVALDDQPIGHLDEVTRADLDTALRYSLDIMY